MKKVSKNYLIYYRIGEEEFSTVMPAHFTAETGNLPNQYDYLKIIKTAYPDAFDNWVKRKVGNNPYKIIRVVEMDETMSNLAPFAKSSSKETKNSTFAIWWIIFILCMVIFGNSTGGGGHSHGHLEHEKDHPVEIHIR